MELLSQVLSELSVEEIFKKRRVCKFWKLTIDDYMKFNFRSFAAYQNDLPINKTWFSTDERVLYKQEIKRTMKMSSDFKELSENRLNGYISTIPSNFIKYLYVDAELSSEFLQTVNHLTQLERLRFRTAYLDRTVVLKLSRLQILDLDIGGKRVDQQLILDTERLTNLRVQCTDTLGFLQFNYPLQITYVEAYAFHPEIRQFLNLEYFYCVYLTDHIDYFSLSFFPQLKELHFNRNGYCLPALISQQREYNRTVKIYYLGVNVSNLDEPIDLNPKSRPHILGEDQVRLMFSNYSNLASRLPFARQLQYSTLRQQLQYSTLRQQIIPEDFHQRLINLVSLSTSGDVDEEHLIEFLERCSNLNRLTISFTNQRFYFKLPELCPRILYLKILVYDSNTPNISKFDFIHRLKYLHGCYIDLKVRDAGDFRFVKKTYKELKFLKKFEFKLQNCEHVQIVYRFDHDKFKLELINYVNYLDDLEEIEQIFFPSTDPLYKIKSNAKRFLSKNFFLSDKSDVFLDKKTLRFTMSQLFNILIVFLSLFLVLMFSFL